jgi:hypothetical protein
MVLSVNDSLSYAVLLEIFLKILYFHDNEFYADKVLVPSEMKKQDLFLEKFIIADYPEILLAIS